MSAAKPRSFKLTRVITPEDDLHAAVVKALRVLLPPAVMWTCFPAGNVPLPPEFAAKLVRFGLAQGWPDLLVVANGHIFGIELKREGGRLSRTRTIRTAKGRLREVSGQEDVFPRLIAAGFAAIAVCHSVDEVLDQLARWQVPTRLAQSVAGTNRLEKKGPALNASAGP